jgi:DNA-binding NarL/FixJ family response regulator
MSPFRIALADAQYLTRLGLRQILSQEESLSVVAECSNESDLLTLIDAQPVDAVVLDYNQPGRFSPETLDRLHAAEGQGPVIVVISADSDKQRIFQVLEAGVGSFLTKECDEAEILDALRAALRGDKFFCTKILNLLLEESLGKTAGKTPDKCDATPLSPREVEIVRLVAAGKVAKEIALQLNLSTHTVYTHRKNITRKLGLNTTSELVRYAIDRGWVE